jgi:hypothetical protein
MCNVKVAETAVRMAGLRNHPIADIRSIRSDDSVNYVWQFPADPSNLFVLDSSPAGKQWLCCSSPQIPPLVKLLKPLTKSRKQLEATLRSTFDRVDRTAFTHPFSGASCLFPFTPCSTLSPSRLRAGSAFAITLVQSGVIEDTVPSPSLRSHRRAHTRP